jgi:hypothetical protein
VRNTGHSYGTSNTYTGTASEAEAILAKETSRVLASHMGAAESLQFRIGPAPEETVRVPASAVRMLVRILEEMATGTPSP